MTIYELKYQKVQANLFNMSVEKNPYNTYFNKHKKICYKKNNKPSIPL